MTWIQVEVMIIMTTRMIHRVRIIIVATIIITQVTIIIVIMEAIIEIIVIIETDNVDQIFSWLINMYHVIIILAKN